jgi:hypothetical protein
MKVESGSSSAQDIEFLAKVAVFWKAKDSLLEGSKQFGRFVIKKCLGQGGFGVVYLAFDPLVGREVAIKVPGVQSLFDESRINRFLSEAQHLRALAHSNIAQVYETHSLSKADASTFPQKSVLLAFDKQLEPFLRGPIPIAWLQSASS